MEKDEGDSSKDQNTEKRDSAYSSRQIARPHLLSPLNPVIVITQAGPTTFAAEKISAENIGWKAYGLSSLPQAWLPPFFLISACCFEGSCSDKTIDGWVAECLSHVGVSTVCQVMVRSSGTSETMQNRGRLISTSCSSSEVATTVRNLITQLPRIPNVKVHWIVQAYVTPKQQGHLSNERYLRREKRDWIVEFEPQAGRPGYAAPVAVRQWRDGTIPTDLDLRCTSELEITIRLKRVAMWATHFSSRIHFEWVWDGKAISIVQADAAEQATGVKPRSLLPIHFHSDKSSSLKVFRPAGQEDYERYGKLRNARVYKRLGYDMPPFYVLDDPDAVNGVLSGRISYEMEADLVELTKRPLIIRTDGTNIPNDKREMLPRSDELRSSAEAKDWLLNSFKQLIKESGLKGKALCLVAHHFIPSVASAWARAEPGQRIVRIESLWGIPEGLYWYSHDTFEVDTQTVTMKSGPPTTPLNYRFWDRLRYKGRFIASDMDGNWIPYETVPPYDWSKSISKESWLFEIAYTTRQVSELENYAVSVMWFIDNHPKATKHKVLPWFHSRSELAGPPKAAPRKKRKGVSDYHITDVGEWERLKQYLQSGKHIERVVIEPVDSNLIRNPQFAKELAGLAASRKFVVELAGGILSHAYYILQSSGAQVECIDLFGAEEEVVEYNKLVRDKIPATIEARGERVETVQLAGDALVTALRQKLVEEAFEALDSKSGEDLIGELADVEEVVRALCRALNVNITHVELEREEKYKQRGGFDNGVMLTKTATPHSIQQQSPALDSSILKLKSEELSKPIISNAAELPAKAIYRRPDLRQVNQQREKMFTFETEVNKLKEVNETLNFLMPTEDHRQQNFSLVVELRRTHSSIRGIVRLRLRPSQFELEFPDSELD